MLERKTPGEILGAAGKLDKHTIAVRYRGHVVDLHTPLETAAASDLTPIRATDPEALPVIRHSTAHVMADAVQRLFPGTKVTIGPAKESLHRVGQHVCRRVSNDGERLRIGRAD